MILLLMNVVMGSEGNLSTLLREKIEDQFSGAKIELKELSGDFNHCRLNGFEETPRAEVRYQATCQDQQVAGVARYSAWITAFAPKQKISPGQRLEAKNLRPIRVDIAQGMQRDNRGLILLATQDYAGFEAKNTLVVDQPILLHQIQKVPDIRRGDSVRVFLLNEEIKLSTQGIAQEPGFINERIRIQTTKTKRELTGLLKEGGIVEVQL